MLSLFVLVLAIVGLGLYSSIKERLARLDDAAAQARLRGDDLLRRVLALEAAVEALRRERGSESPVETTAAAPTHAPSESPVLTTQPPPSAPEPAPAAPQPAAAVPERIPALPTPSMPFPEPVMPPARPAVPAGPPPDAPPVPPPTSPFNWESLVGVKLFSAVAGIALVIAALFFLRYSIDQGWLQPVARVTIGALVAVALLITCELKAARRYPVTANALDAAAVAILFSTTFAAHALWNLIPGSVAFVLLGLVTAVAVLLSVRRESLFIAVLGLLGGFAAPVLLSTGENRPIPLFSYLLLLNIGLAWVASRNRWPGLSWLSLLFTVIYQAGWVGRFLEASTLPLAMGVFLVFPLAAIAGLVLRRSSGAERSPAADSLERAALVSAVVPALFAVYLAAVPAYGARPGLLFGFLALVDAGLLAVALARREERLHAAGAATTTATAILWTATSYPGTASWAVFLPLMLALITFYLLAPSVARRVARPFAGAGVNAIFAGPLLLSAMVVLAGIEPDFRAPLPLFATLFAAMLLIAWRAIAERRGALYHLAAVFAVTIQAVWSAAHLTADRLGSAVLIYSVFGLLSLAVPAVARRVARPLGPAWGSGAALLASLLLLLFISLTLSAAPALWALALLLAIMNAALFIESGASGLPLVSRAGSLLSWLILASWWARAGASVGVIPSLTVLTGLTLVTLGGHAWTARLQSSALDTRGALPSGRTGGVHLGLIGHFFLIWVAANPEWSTPSGPFLGSLFVMTIAASTAALFSRAPSLHAAATIAAAVVVLVWSAAAGASYGLVAVLTSFVVCGYALAWLPIVSPREANLAALCSFFVAAFSTLIATGVSAASDMPLPFPVVVVAHAAVVVGILALAWRSGWLWIAVAAVWPAWLALLEWQVTAAPERVFSQLLTFAVVLYALFVVYPLVLGRRAAAAREPYVAAVVASVMAFFAGRSAFLIGGFDWMVGVVPVAIGLVLVLLLRQLLAIQPAGERDTGRLALVAGAALGFGTVAVPLQLEHQWITVGWALEGAALAWLHTRIPHRGLRRASVALLAVVFVRLALNPEILMYEPRGDFRIFNWYLYTYLLCAGALLAAARWFATAEGCLRPDGTPPHLSRWMSAAAGILLFWLLNIEIADFYATGPRVTFEFGASVAQDLTYTIGWLLFGMSLLVVGISASSRPARITAVALIAVTTCKAFLYDLSSLEGLYRVASFVGLAISLALVSLTLQKFVLSKPEQAT